jgi:hypothetical protein
MVLDHEGVMAQYESDRDSRSSAVNIGDFHLLQPERLYEPFQAGALRQAKFDAERAKLRGSRDRSAAGYQSTSLSGVRRVDLGRA